MAQRSLSRVLALLFTPLVVLGSAHELYLRNQQELEGSLSVLAPFWAAAAAAVLLGALLQRLDATGPGRAALWAWYGLGFGFMAWSFLRALPQLARMAQWILDTPAGAGLFAANWLVALVALRRVPPRALEPLLAVLAIVLLAGELAAFATRFRPHKPAPPRDLAAEAARGTRARLPNIYHVILDSFQDELFEPCLPAGTPLGTAGFLRYHATTTGRATAVVLPTIFTGRRLEEMALAGRLQEGLQGESSLLVTLRRAGYRTVGFVPRFLYRHHEGAGPGTGALDVSVFHEDNLEAAARPALHGLVFRRLWASQLLPLAVTNLLARRQALGLDAEFLRSVRGQRLSVYTQPTTAAMSLQNILEIEPSLPPSGRYTLVHLLLPHNPYLLRSDCSSEPDVRATDLRQQTDCTLLLLGRYVQLLEKLGRLEPSVVLVHGDHGAGLTLRDDRLVVEEAAADRTLLLVKPAGARGPLRTATEAAGVLDIAPTLAALAALPHRAPFEGRVLQEALEFAQRGGSPH